MDHETEKPDESNEAKPCEARYSQSCTLLATKSKSQNESEDPEWCGWWNGYGGWFPPQDF
ncbi:MAG: hypothetical protein AB7T86_10045 [Xanthobacteraceae bacterium]|uniref:hypothetical protein n=1 Tax=Pseudolabrys sp. TaxID=1960880 RepID=UPI003D103562